MRRGMLRNRDKPPYALPTIFTVGTLFCGYFCLMKTVQAISLGADEVAQAAILYNHAAIAIGLCRLHRRSRRPHRPRNRSRQRLWPRNRLVG